MLVRSPHAWPEPSPRKRREILQDPVVLVDEAPVGRMAKAQRARHLDGLCRDQAVTPLTDQGLLAATAWPAAVGRRHEGVRADGLSSAALRTSARVTDRAATAAPAWLPDAHANGRGVSSGGRSIVHDDPANDGRCRDYSHPGAEHTLRSLTSRQHRIFRHWSRPRLTGPLWRDLFSFRALGRQSLWYQGHRTTTRDSRHAAAARTHVVDLRRGHPLMAHEPLDN
jgi:hypothetical protein